MGEQHWAEIIFKVPPEVIISPRQMVQIKVPRVSWKQWSIVNGTNRTIVDCDLLVVADVEIIPRYERATETSGISELRLSTLINNIRVETKEMRIEYPDEIKRQYWEDLIKTVFTDLFEPIRELLRNDSVNLVRKFRELFDIES